MGEISWLTRYLSKESPIRKFRNKEKKSPKMERQKKNLQSKGMENSPLKELNEMDVSKLSDIEFKIMVTKMIKELTRN